MPGLPPDLLLPGLTAGLAWGMVIATDVPPVPYYAPPGDAEVVAYPPPPNSGIIEPPTGRLLLTAFAGLLLARFAVWHGRVAPG
jgi:hypothetical protein